MVLVVLWIQLALVSWSSVRNHRQLPGSACWCRRMQVCFKIPLSCVCCCLWKQIWHLLSRSLDYWACTSFSKCCEPVMTGRFHGRESCSHSSFNNLGRSGLRSCLLVITWVIVHPGTLSQCTQGHCHALDWIRALTNPFKEFHYNEAFLWQMFCSHHFLFPALSPNWLTE